MGLHWIMLLASCDDEQLPRHRPPVFCSCPPAAPTEDHVTDRFVVAAPERVDLLFVLDSSGPLADATPLVENAPLWLDRLVDGHDLHVGVVTADLDDPDHQGKLIEAQGMRWIDGSTADPLGVFAELVEVGTGGSPTVQALGAAYTALEVHRDTFNAGFLRDDSAVQVVVVSDGDDQTEPGLPTGTEFVDWLDALRPDNRSFSCLTPGEPVSGACAEIAAALGGVDGDLTDPAAHRAIGYQFSGPRVEFFLRRIPVGGTVEVQVEDPRGPVLELQEAYGAEGDWTFDPERNSVRLLQYVPADGAVVVVDYQAVH